MSAQNIERNKAIVLLRKIDPDAYSYGVLANIFGLTRVAIVRIYYRDKDRYLLPEKIKGNVKE